MIKTFAAMLVLASAPAIAQPAPGALDSSPAYSVTSNEIARSYGDIAPRDDAKTVLAKLRAVCASDRGDDKRRCADGMKVLNAGYRKLLEKRAAAAAPN